MTRPKPFGLEYTKYLECTKGFEYHQHVSSADIGGVGDFFSAVAQMRLDPRRSTLIYFMNPGGHEVLIPSLHSGDDDE